LPIASPPPPAPIVVIAGYFTGTWTCNGSFSNGKPIGATIRFEQDLNGMAIVVHHDDSPATGMYHSIEIWGYQKSASNFSSSMYDAYSGARSFSSPGWNGDALTWTSSPPVTPEQQFVYTKRDAHTFVVDWKVNRAGTFVVGDTLTCSAQRP
jgi:hypothetical protein